MRSNILTVKNENVPPVARGPLKKLANTSTSLKKPLFKSSKDEKSGTVSKKKKDEILSGSGSGIAANFYSVQDLKDIAALSLGNNDYESLLSADYAFQLCQQHKSQSEVETVEYALEIMFYEQDREFKDLFNLQPFILDKNHPDVAHATLARVTNWITSMQSSFDLNHETIHLAVGLLYAYFSKTKNVARTNVPKIGFSSLWLAIKFEERGSPSVESMLECLNEHFPDSIFGRRDTLLHEMHVLKAINMGINRPNAYVLFRRYSRIVDQNDSLVQYVGRFLLEVSLHSYNGMIAGESRRAAACLCLARCLVFCMTNLEDESKSMTSEEIWPSVLFFFTRQSLVSLASVMNHLHNKAMWLVIHAMTEDDMEFEMSMEKVADEDELLRNTSMDSMTHPDREIPFTCTVEKYGNIVFNKAAVNYVTYGADMWVKLRQLLNVE